MLGPEWQAMQREAQLAAEQVAHGATVLGRANHAQTGLYNQAFFGLSIGLERVGKLIFLADHAIDHQGKFPSNGDLRAIGHDVVSLLDTCERIAKRIDLKRDYAARPSDVIHIGIVEVLSLFATSLRYYNLDHLSGRGSNQTDPIAMWWEKVASPICDRHYTTRQREQDEREAALAEEVFGRNSLVIHSSEDGKPIQSISEMCMQSRATRVVQQYGRMYVLQIIRWISSIVFELSHTGAYERGIEALLGLHEPFAIFRNEDAYLRRRKRWSIYRL